MSRDVGVGENKARDVGAQRLAKALTETTAGSATDRILARGFWCSARPAQSGGLASVISIRPSTPHQLA